jgi:hypothetical protein
MTNYFDFMWCVKALRRAKAVPAWIRHFDLEMYDLIFDICEQLYGDASVILPNYVRTRNQPALLRHGMHFALQHQHKQLQLAMERPGASAGAAPMRPASAMALSSGGRAGESAVQYMSRSLGVQHVRACRSMQDIQQLLAMQLSANDFTTNSQRVATTALRAGMLIFPSNVAGLLQRFKSDAAAWPALEELQYRALQHRLRDEAVAVIPPMAQRRVASSMPPPAGAGASGAMPLPVAAIAGRSMESVQLQLAGASTVRTAAPEVTGTVAPLTDEQRAQRKRAQSRERQQRKRQRHMQQPLTQEQQDAQRQVWRLAKRSRAKPKAGNAPPPPSGT